MNPAGRVAVFGSLNVDLVWQVPALPGPGRTVLAQAVQRQFGGKGANQAVAAARSGARVAMVGAVGDDADGPRYREHLVREGIDVEAIVRVPGAATGTAHICVDPQGENQIVVDRGANAQLKSSALRPVLPQVAVLLAQLETDLGETVAALRLAAAHGIRSVLNASPVAVDFPWGALALDTVVVNEHECRECFAHPPETIAGWASAERGAFLAARKISHLVVTQGAAPTRYFSALGTLTIPTHPVQPRDTVGAGDTFAGALAAELAAGREWPGALRYANVAAALSTLALGAQAAMPRRTEVAAAQSGAGL